MRRQLEVHPSARTKVVSIITLHTNPPSPLSPEDLELEDGSEGRHVLPLDKEYGATLNGGEGGSLVLRYGEGHQLLLLLHTSCPPPPPPNHSPDRGPPLVLLPKMLMMPKTL